MRTKIFSLMCGLAVPLLSSGQEWLDRVDDALFVQTRNGEIRADLSGLFDVEGYYVEQPPPGLVFGDDNTFLNLRLTLFLDVQLGRHVYGFVQFRADQGFDPNSADRDARFDEYLLRYTPFDDARLNVQWGKFATVVGNWVNRHYSWDNPFITAPLPYENITIASDQLIPLGPVQFLARKNLPDNKTAWLPVIWGPSYTSGGSVFGTIERFDYAVEFKNASISSRPAVWSAMDLNWDNPTVSARLGYRPSAPWNLGMSFSRGTYLIPQAADAPAFPTGQRLADFDQTTFGADLSYAWHHFQLWSEVFVSRFDVPNVGNCDTLAYYLEAKYKFNTMLYGALRWNQQFYADINNGVGGESPWDRNAWQIDVALGCRLTRHLLGKIQYSITDEADDSPQGSQLVAAQVTLKF